MCVELSRVQLCPSGVLPVCVLTLCLRLCPLQTVVSPVATASPLPSPSPSAPLAWFLGLLDQVGVLASQHLPAVPQTVAQHRILLKQSSAHVAPCPKPEGHFLWYILQTASWRGLGVTSRAAKEPGSSGSLLPCSLARHGLQDAHPARAGAALCPSVSQPWSTHQHMAAQDTLLLSQTVTASSLALSSTHCGRARPQVQA